MTIKEQARLDRIARLAESLEADTEEIKSLESQLRAVRARRKQSVIKLAKAGMSERQIGALAGMAGPSVHEIINPRGPRKKPSAKPKLKAVA